MDVTERTPPSGPPPGPPPEAREVSAAWGGPFVMGTLLVLLGIFAFIAAGITSLATAIMFGILLFVAGILEIVYAFRVRRGGRFTLYFLGGIFSVVVGVLFLVRPLAGLAALSLLLAGYFFATGLFRGITSVMDRYPRWYFDFFYGVVAVLLGVLIVAQWPISSLWIVGALVGAEIASRGIAMMAVALEMRRVLRQTPATV